MCMRILSSNTVIGLENGWSVIKTNIDMMVHTKFILKLRYYFT